MAAGQPQGMDRMQDQAFHAQVISQMDLLRRFNIADAMSGDKDSATDAWRFKEMLTRQPDGKTVEFCVALLQIDGGMTQEELHEVARGTREEANAAALRTSGSSGSGTTT